MANPITTWQQGLQQDPIMPASNIGDVALNTLASYLRQSTQKKERAQLAEDLSSILKAGSDEERMALAAESKNPAIQEIFLSQMLKGSEKKNPFGGDSQASLLNTALYGDVDDPATIAAVEMLGKDRVTVDAYGNKVTIPGYVPTSIQSRFQPTAGTGSKGSGAVDLGGGTTYEPSPIARPEDTRKYNEEYSKIQSSVNNMQSFGDTLAKYGPQAGVDLPGGVSISKNPQARQELKTAYSNLIGELKGENFLALGVLAGPDLGIVQSMLPPPDEVGALTNPEKYITGYNKAVDFINNKIKVYNSKWEGSNVKTKEIPLMKKIGESTSATGNAPPAAIEYLKKNPDKASAFKAKYGYLPEGF